MGALRVAWKDLYELLEGARGITLVLVLPPLLLLLVGQLQKRTPESTILLAGVEECAVEASEWDSGCMAKRLLEELASATIVVQPQIETDPIRRMIDEEIDLVVNWDEASDGFAWTMTTAETDPRRLAQLGRLTAGLERAFFLITLRDDETDSEAASAKEQAQEFLGQLLAAGALPRRPLVVHYPQASSRPLTFLPNTIALILCFLPFVLAAPGWIREQESRTLEVLLAAPGIGGPSIFIGKCIVPLLVTLFDFLLMLVLVQSVYDLNVKAGLGSILLFLVPPILASTFLGIAVSTTVRAQSQTVIAAAVYFLALNLLSGFLYSIEMGSATVRALSKLSPLTFVHPPLGAWMFGAASDGSLPGLSWWLIAQAALYGLLAVLLFREALRRL